MVTPEYEAVKCHAPGRIYRCTNHIQHPEYRE
jgi:hypothetical protein